MSNYEGGSGDGVDDEETPEERRARHDRDAWRSSRGRHKDRARSVRLVSAVKASVFGGGLDRIEYDLLIVAFDDPRESAEAWRRYTSPYVTNDILRSADEAKWEQVNIDIENIPAVHPSNGVRFGTNRWIYPCSRERELLDSLREHFAQVASRP
jgi:hypothetical protein